MSGCGGDRPANGAMAGHLWFCPGLRPGPTGPLTMGTPLSGYLLPEPLPATLSRSSIRSVSRGFGSTRRFSSSREFAGHSVAWRLAPSGSAETGREADRESARGKSLPMVTIRLATADMADHG
jgi:hypothetical protein